ncbi:hypothetical protein HanPSC8_Chr14g0641091 [Helianthus annuus]|nr:hypothetical protein HanPSC8_Chr14g0641091 [Helianthus annuus]
MRKCNYPKLSTVKQNSKELVYCSLIMTFGRQLVCTPCLSELLPMAIGMYRAATRRILLLV